MRVLVMMVFPFAFATVVVVVVFVRVFRNTQHPRTPAQPDRAKPHPTNRARSRDLFEGIYSHPKRTLVKRNEQQHKMQNEHNTQRITNRRQTHVL